MENPMKEIRVVVVEGKEWVGAFDESIGQLTEAMLCSRGGIHETLQHWVARSNAGQLLSVDIKGDFLSRSLDDQEQKALQRFIEDMEQVKKEAIPTLQNHLYFNGGKLRC